MPRLTEQEQQEIIRFIEADRPLPDKYRFLLFEDKREVEMSFVGIDVSKTQLDIAERPGNKRWSAVNAEADIGKVVETVGALSPQVIEMLTAEKNRLGISPKVALSCMRKLLVILNAIMKNRIPWQADYSTCPTPQIP